MGLMDRIRKMRETEEDEMRRTLMERQQMMFNFECVGVGKAGIGFLDSLLGMDRASGVNQVYPMALASSRFDYEFVQHVDKENHLFPLGSGDREVRYTGVGGNQRLGQRIAMQDVHRVIAKIREDTELYRKKIPMRAIVIAGSLGGGTGGGSIPFLAKALKLSFPRLLVIVVGILPDIREGNVYFVNASRSFRMMWSLMNREQKYIDTLFLFENPEKRRGGQYNALLKINDEFATTFNLVFGSGYSAYTLDPQDRVMVLKKGRGGISLMSYWKDTANVLSMRQDSEIEVAKSDCELMMRGNLGEYPPGTVEGAQFAAFQIRCQDKYIPRDLKNILTKLIENKLAGIEPEERTEQIEEEIVNEEPLLEREITANPDERKTKFVPIVKGGAWALRSSRTIEMASMIVGIDPKKYEYLNGIWDMYEVLYGDTFRQDLNQIWNWRLRT
jgi:cell division GTPase FtsZ